MMDTDIVVIGGGSAGYSAANTACSLAEQTRGVIDRVTQYYTTLTYRF